MYFSYGRRSNRYLLLTYGFVLRENEWDEYSIQVSLQRDNPDFHSIAQCKFDCVVFVHILPHQKDKEP